MIVGECDRITCDILPQDLSTRFLLIQNTPWSVHFFWLFASHLLIFGMASSSFCRSLSLYIYVIYVYKLYTYINTSATSIAQSQESSMFTFEALASFCHRWDMIQDLLEDRRAKGLSFWVAIGPVQLGQQAKRKAMLLPKDAQSKRIKQQKQNETNKSHIDFACWNILCLVWTITASLKTESKASSPDHRLRSPDSCEQPSHAKNQLAT